MLTYVLAFHSLNVVCSACQVLDFVLPECVASQHDLWCCELLGKTIALCDKCCINKRHHSCKKGKVWVIMKLNAMLPSVLFSSNCTVIKCIYSTICIIPLFNNSRSWNSLTFRIHIRPICRATGTGSRKKSDFMICVRSPLCSLKQYMVSTIEM